MYYFRSKHQQFDVLTYGPSSLNCDAENYVTEKAEDATNDVSMSSAIRVEKPPDDTGLYATPKRLVGDDVTSPNEQLCIQSDNEEHHSKFRACPRKDSIEETVPAIVAQPDLPVSTTSTARPSEAKPGEQCLLFGSWFVLSNLR